MPDGSHSDLDLVVRVGKPTDIDDVMELALMGANENGFRKPAPPKILHAIWQALNLNHGIMGVIGPREGKLQGAVLLRVCMPWYSDERFLEEQAIFIHPDYRSAKGGRASRMVEFSKMTAARLDLPLMIGVLSNSRTEGKIRLYRRHFGEPAGAYFLHNAVTGGAVKAVTSE